MEIIVSIVIPFYCTPKPLFNKCMESILGVRSNEIEIIVIDDGSSEEYLPIVDYYVNNPQVKIIHKKNAGVSAARNRGIQEASGKWVLFCDSDDYVNTDALKEVLMYAKTHSGDVVLFNGGCDKEGKISYNTTFLRQGINYAANEKKRIAIMESALSVGQIPEGYRQYFSLGAPVCKLLRTNFLKEHNLLFDTNVKFAEDTLFSLQVYNKAEDIRFINLIFYYYVFYRQSATRRYRPGISVDMDVFFERAERFLKDNELTDKLGKAYYVRAEFETGRAMVLDFFHPKNDSKNANASYLSFIQKEPYRTALACDNLSKRSIKQKIKRYLIQRGYFRLFNIGRSIIAVFSKP